MTVTVTIRDEVDRATLVGALWRCLSHPVGESALDNETWEAGRLEYDEEKIDAHRRGVDDRLQALTRIRSQIDVVEQAELGTIVLDLDPVLLAYEFKNLREGISEDDEFFEAPKALRDRRLAIYDATGELMANLPDAEYHAWDELKVEVA